MPRPKVEPPAPAERTGNAQTPGQDPGRAHILFVSTCIRRPDCPHPEHGRSIQHPRLYRGPYNCRPAGGIHPAGLSSACGRPLPAIYGSLPKGAAAADNDMELPLDEKPGSVPDTGRVVSLDEFRKNRNK